jgi:hypothetical protein
MYAPASPEQRDRLLREIGGDFRRDSAVVGLFLAGSLAAGTADAHSDIDLRVVVEPSALSRFCAQRLSRPTRWSGFLFNEWGDDETCCVSHFENFAKVDIFYISADGLRPSPWLALPIRALHDATGTIEAARANSAGLDASAEPIQIERVLGKTISYAIEVARRVARGELVYAQSLLDGLRNRIVALEDLLENRTPGINCSLKVEKRVSPQLLEVLYAACPHAERAELQVALAGLVRVCREFVSRLRDGGKLGSSPTAFLRALDALAQ